ncbi:hypothetical protein O0882_08310 [Janthinobacterium sp. SUN073]|uniref:hypothetical protein n=1 Tax=Janthinobacterium sp. SUN073 TaxID=3004102 RepID=UPI0025AF6F5F|nr:hypothetical protein [Janthinobacterium sp. SUN073]MDN2696316.1 hypothetical protein [Janthinobacterium sp. SUN073]
MFEAVYRVWDLYDGPRTCITSGDEYAQRFTLTPIGAPLLALAVEQWQIFWCWELQ